MRGDPPPVAPGDEAVTVSTPHARGSTLYSRFPGCLRRVYPACAGIHLAGSITTGSTTSLPRMRGDPPAIQHFTGIVIESTPHARGSTVA